MIVVSYNHTIILLYIPICTSYRIENTTMIVYYDSILPPHQYIAIVHSTYCYDSGIGMRVLLLATSTASTTRYDTYIMHHLDNSNKRITYIWGWCVLLIRKS